MDKIRQFRVTRDNRGGVEYYAQASDTRDGYYYATGNDYHGAGTFSRHLTAEEWQEAIRIATWDGEVHTVSVEEMDEAYSRAGIEIAEPQVAEVKQPGWVRKNRKGQHCCRCGRWVEAGQGHLFFVGDEDVQFGPAGWLVQCLDTDECMKIADAKEAQKREKEEKLQARRDDEVDWEAWEEFFDKTQYTT